ncbi:MAG: S41 family peptidase [Myxococcota bacterium]
MGRRAGTLGLALSLAGACSNDSAPAQEPAKSAPEADVEPTEPEPKCRDWSTLDLDEVPPLAEGKHAPLLDTVWRRVLEKHFDPTLGCLDWAKLREVHAEKIAEAANPQQAYAIVNDLLGELKQSHLRLFPPTPDEDTPGPVAPPITVRWVDDQLVVVDSRAEGLQGPVLRGATVLGIDDVPIGKIVEQVRARHPEHAFPRMIATTAAARMSCQRLGQFKKLKVTNPAKEQRNAIRVVPCLEPEGERITLGNLRDVPTRVEHRLLEQGRIGVMHFNVWMLPMVKRMEAAMTELRGKGMRGLILDLRGNPGGVGAMAVPVARMLVDEEVSLGTMRFRDFEQELNVEPSGDAFGGPVAILVDEGTASTSEIFIVGLRDHGRVKVFGSRASAGAALPSVIEELPGGALLQYVVADYRSPKGTLVEGTGIEPDVVVAETRDDFAAGRDPVLMAAHGYLNEQLGPVADPTADPSVETGPSADGAADSTGAAP